MKCIAIKYQTTMRTVKCTVILIGLFVLPSIFAQDSLRYNVDFIEVVHHLISETYTSNPAALCFMPKVEYGNIFLQYGAYNGNFKPVMRGNGGQQYKFSTQKFKRLNNTVFWGKFDVEKSYERGADFNSTNDAYGNTPYLMIDTVGDDLIDREFYTLSGAFSHPLSKFKIGGLINYKAGLTAQNHDPRAKSTLSALTLKPGVFYEFGAHKIGAHFLYQYYNEEVDVNIVQHNTQHNMFYMLGLRAAVKQSAASFARVYQNNVRAAELQYAVGGMLITLSRSWFNQTVQDGGTGTYASWVAIKDFGSLRSSKNALHAVYGFGKTEYKHQLKGFIAVENRIGTEIEQRLAKYDEQFEFEWVTLNAQDAYTHFKLDAGINYSLMKMQEHFTNDYTFNLNLNYSKSNEKYIPFNDRQSFSNLMFGADFSKKININTFFVDVGGGLMYRLNMDKDLQITNAISNYEVSMPDYFSVLQTRVLEVDFEYFTSNYIMPKLHIYVERPVGEGFR